MMFAMQNENYGYLCATGMPSIFFSTTFSDSIHLFLDQT
jgi:hypothetical protein